MQTDILQNKKALRLWLENLERAAEHGIFRFCLEGDLTSNSRQSHILFKSVFVIKILLQSGLWEEWPETSRKKLIESVKAFQAPDGNFNDPWSLSIPFYKKSLYALRGLETTTIRENIIKGETRQSYSALLSLGEHPDYRLSCPYKTSADIERYLDSLPWDNPWNAGSQWSSLIFILANSDAAPDLIQTAAVFLDRLYDKETGCWYRGNVSQQHKMNGAMKIYSGQQWLPQALKIHDNKPLETFSLQQMEALDGCGFLNQLFVLSCLYDHAQPDVCDQIETYALSALKHIEKFYHEDEGGFSFFPNKSQTHFYYRKVSEGKNTADLHGSVLLTQALALIDEILYAGEHGWHISKM